MPLIALTREVPDSMADCELTHRERSVIDIVAARAQHAQYEQALRAAGCSVERISPLPAHPDSVFVEDAAILLEELAVITRPGAESRRGEIDSVAEALRRYRTVVRITAPATIDGGDVLRIGRKLFVGLSSRTNLAAVEQLRGILEPHGHDVIAVAVGGVLHLKSAVTQVGPSQLLINRAWIDPDAFEGFQLIDVDPSEPDAANALLINGLVLFPAAFPRTRARLERDGIRVVTVEASEVGKAEGALTCCSLIFNETART